jgi:hypothetical protein
VGSSGVATQPLWTTCCWSSPSCCAAALLDQSELLRRGDEAKINPPLRCAPLPPDGLDLISSDYVGWPPDAKPGPDIFALASGAHGVELIVALVHDALGAAELVRLVCSPPRTASACGRARAA